MGLLWLRSMALASWPAAASRPSWGSVGMFSLLTSVLGSAYPGSGPATPTDRPTPATSGTSSSVEKVCTTMKGPKTSSCVVRESGAVSTIVGSTWKPPASAGSVGTFPPLSTVAPEPAANSR